MMENNVGDYGDFMNPILFKEFLKASMFDTKNAIYQRAIKGIIQALNMQHVFLLSSSISASSNKIFVHPDVCAQIEELYKQLIQNDIKMDQLTTKFSIFKTTATDIYDISAVKNLVKEFQKCLEIIKETAVLNKKDKNLKDNRLNIILAVDGLQGALPADLIHYMSNLSVGNTATKLNDYHVLGVRDMYRKLPSILTGTDSTYIVTKALLTLWADKINDDDQRITLIKEIGVIDNYLSQLVQYYKEIEQVISQSFLDQLVHVYTSQVQDDDSLMVIATEKLTTFRNYLKKKQQQSDISSQKRKHSQETTNNIEEEGGAIKEEEEEEEVAGPSFAKKKFKKPADIVIESTEKKSSKKRSHHKSLDPSKKKVKTMNLIKFMSGGKQQQRQPLLGEEEEEEGNYYEN